MRPPRRRSENCCAPATHPTIAIAFAVSALLLLVADERPVDARDGLLPDPVEAVGARPGPVVLVVAGIHGDEPAGRHAAEAIAAWPIARGRLVVVSPLHRAAAAAGTRRGPDAPGDGDLNRCFPRASGEVPRGALAEEVWELVRRLRPDWLLDLHEGVAPRRVDPESVGNSVIASTDPRAAALATRLVAAADRHVSDEKARFTLLSRPAEGSLARAAHERLGVATLILETSRRGPLSRRIAQHRTMVRTALEHIGLLEAGGLGALEALGARGPDGTLHVAIWDDAGSARSVSRIEARLRARANVVTRRVGADDIARGLLAPFDVVVLPSGHAGRQSERLGPVGREALREFVRAGGGYVGIAAGALLASSGDERWLALAPVTAVSAPSGAPTGRLLHELLPAGRRLLGAEASAPVLQYDGASSYRPVPQKDGAIEPLLALEGRWVGVRARFGDGAAILLSSHPESADEDGETLERLLRGALVELPSDASPRPEVRTERR